MVKFVRDGKLVWPFCEECGCRLNISNGTRYTERLLTHYGMHPNKDARGCSCKVRYAALIVKSEQVANFES